MKIEALISDSATNNHNVPAHNWADTRKKKYNFPVLEECTGAGFDIARIHPLKQRSILKIANALKSDGRVECAIVFGSSCGIRCGRGSDIDICLKINSSVGNANEIKNDISEKVQEACGFDADILWADHIKSGSNIYNNIKMGVELL